MEDTLTNDKTIKQTSSNGLTSHINPQPTVEYIENKDNPEDLDITWSRWKCLKCGYVYEGQQELKKCPKCGNENPDLFMDVD